MEILVRGGLWEFNELVPFMRASVPLVHVLRGDIETDDISANRPCCKEKCSINQSIFYTTA